MFRAHVLINRRSKLHYTASGVITPIGGRLVHRLREMHGQQNVKICDANQAKQIHQYKNTKMKLYKSTAVI